MIRFSLLLIILSGLSFSSLYAQNQAGGGNQGGINQGGNQGANNVAGIYVDIEGILRFRQQYQKKSTRRIRIYANEEITWISLPELFREANQSIENNQPIPSDVAFMRGLVDLRQLRLDPLKKDLLIGGIKEDYDASNSFRPLGKQSGRPVLQLSDMIVILQSFLIDDQQATHFGCSIDMSQQSLDRIIQASQQMGAISRHQSARAASIFREACGYQSVRFLEVPGETRFAFVCLEADYILKQLSLGLISSPVPGIRSHLSMAGSRESIYNRWWFVEDYQGLLMSDDGFHYEIQGASLKVLAGSVIPTSGVANSNNGPVSVSAQRFADQVTSNFSKLSTQIPAFADLVNLTNLAIVAALIRDDQLANQIQWDISEILQTYPVQKFIIPQQVEPLVNYKSTRNAVSFAVGGVLIDTEKVLQSRNQSQSR